MQKAVLLAALALAATACGDFLPEMPESPHHKNRTPPAPQPATSRASAPRSATAPLPQPSSRPLVDYSALDASAEHSETEPPDPVPTRAERPRRDPGAEPLEPDPSAPAASAAGDEDDDEDGQDETTSKERRNWRDRYAPRIELLDPGAEPRSPLALALEKGHAETITMKMGMGLSLTVEGQQVEAPEMPDLSMRLRVYVTDVRLSGDIAYEAVVHDAELLFPEAGKHETRRQRKLRSALEKATEGLVGLSGTGVVSPRGITKQVRFGVPSSASKEVKDFLDQVQNSASQFSAPLPEEPVGVGAEWRVRTFVHQRGMRMTQIANYKVLRRDARGASLLVQVTQLAEPQRLSLPDMPRGAVVKLERLRGQGSGRVVIAPDRLGPVTSQLDLRTEFEMSARQGSRTETLAMALSLDLDLSTGELADGVRLTGGEDGGPKRPRRSRIVR